MVAPAELVVKAVRVSYRFTPGLAPRRPLLLALPRQRLGKQVVRVIALRQRYLNIFVAKLPRLFVRMQYYLGRGRSVIRAILGVCRGK